MMESSYIDAKPWIMQHIVPQRYSTEGKIADRSKTTPIYNSVVKKIEDFEEKLRMQDKYNSPKMPDISVQNYLDDNLMISPYEIGVVKRNFEHDVSTPTSSSTTSSITNSTPSCTIWGKAKTRPYWEPTSRTVTPTAKKCRFADQCEDGVGADNSQ